MQPTFPVKFSTPFASAAQIPFDAIEAAKPVTLTPAQKLEKLFNEQVAGGKTDDSAKASLGRTPAKGRPTSFSKVLEKPSGASASIRKTAQPTVLTRAPALEDALPRDGKSSESGVWGHGEFGSAVSF